MRYIKLLIISLTQIICEAWTCGPMLESYSSSATSPRTQEKTSTTLTISNAPFLPDIDIQYHPITVASSPSTGTTTNGANAITKSPNYLIHKGRAVDMIKRCVSIEGLSVSTGWTPQATEAFKLAIEAVVRANPILTGKLVEKKKSWLPWSHRSELWIVPNAFPPESHSFVTFVDPPSDMASPGEVARDGLAEDVTVVKDLFGHVHQNVAPSLMNKTSFSANQIEEGSPLFQAKLMDFGDGVAAYSIEVSHAIGDGTTFFQIVSQISSYMNGRDPAPIDWDNPLKATHEIYPEIFSERDYHRSYGLPFGWGVFKNIRTLNKRKCRYLLLSKDKIAQKKKELRSTSTGTDNGAKISANDIIMSSLCEMCGSSDIFAFDRSVRGIKQGVSKSAAGNFFWEIPFDIRVGANPFEIRKIMSSEKGVYFDTDEVPLMPSLNGRVGRITSLASIAHQANFPGSNVICQFPSAAFIKDLPLDVAVIFRFDKEPLGYNAQFQKDEPVTSARRDYCLKHVKH